MPTRAVPEDGTAFHPRTLGMAMTAAHKRDEFLRELHNNEGSISATCKAVGRSYQTYARWRANSPHFAAEVDRIRMEILRRSAGVDSPDNEVAWDGNFATFRKRFFGFDTYGHQAQFVRLLDNPKPGTITMILWPPEFGKSSCYTDWICMKLAMTPNYRVGVATAGLNLAKKIVGRVKKRMTDHRIAHDYIDRFGPFKMPGLEDGVNAWTANAIAVYKAALDAGDYSLEAQGWNSEIQGTRLDTLLLDDVQSRKTLNLTDKIVETIQQTWITRVGKNGAVYYIGNRIGPGDVMVRMIDLGMVDRVIEVPALDKQTGEPTCPEMWPLDDLAKRRKLVGATVWATTYQQEDDAGEDRTFTEEIIESAKDYSRRRGDIPDRRNLGIYQDRPPGEVWTTWLTMASCDPALTNWNVVATFAYDPVGLHVLDFRRDRALGTPSSVIDRIDLVARRVGFEDLVIESNSWQKGYVDDDALRDCRNSNHFTVHKHVTAGNKMDVDFGVAKMADEMEAGRITFPYHEDPATREIMDVFVKEMRQWRPYVQGKKLQQDMLMTVWMAWLLWRRRRRRLFERGRSASQFETSGLPYAPTGLAS